MLLFVGSSTCPWSTHPDLPEAVEALKVRLAAYAQERGLTFRAIAVSVDWVTENGVQYLGTLGAFDEIAVGGNWANSVLLDHVWERGGRASTPSVFIYSRRVVQEADSVLLEGLGREAEALLVSRSGLPDIRTLAELGPDRFLAGVKVRQEERTMGPEGS